MLVRVPLYSQTEKCVEAYFLKVKSDSPNRYLMPFVNAVN